MSPLALPCSICNRLRDATGFYSLQSAGSREYLFRHRLELQASICNSIARLFNENLHDPHATDPSTTLARFTAMVAGSVSDYFKHKLILLQRLSDWRGPIAERLGETATTSPAKKSHSMVGCSEARFGAASHRLRSKRWFEAVRPAHFMRATPTQDWVQRPADLFDSRGHCIEFAVRTLDNPTFGIVSLLARPQLAFGVARVIVVDQFSLNTIPAPHQNNCCHRLLLRWLGVGRPLAGLRSEWKGLRSGESGSNSLVSDLRSHSSTLLFASPRQAA